MPKPCLGCVCVCVCVCVCGGGGGREVMTCVFLGVVLTHCDAVILGPKHFRRLGVPDIGVKCIVYFTRKEEKRFFPIGETEVAAHR